ncbi:UNVERIFIED_CONTAM: hypothetical protein PYX00_008387 [Menopon gallinae]|uniref:Uncharacterized protein n=1 Tax=Menopon gallinae TaxID=328185 RepID=A0AAW2HMR0_9NEOP
MRISVILLTLILSSNCLSYKLRRDLRTVRQYCEKICTGCGGKASLRLDVCICKDDEQSTGLDKCFEKARNKLDFLGIKWEVPRKTIEKRSIYSPNHPSPIDHDIYFKRGRKTLIKRSDGSLKKGPAKTQIMGLQWGLQPKQVSPKGKSRQRRSFDRFKLIFGPSRFSDNTFQPVENYQANLGAPFKLLLAGSEPTNFNGNSPYGILNKQQPTILIDNNKPTEWIDDDDDEEDEDDSSSEEFMDYEYSQGCEDGFRIERLLSEPWRRLNIYFSA